MSPGTEHAGPPPTPVAVGQSLGEETVPLRGAEDRESERRREERVRLVVGRAPGRRWLLGRRTALCVGVASLVLGALAVIALAGSGAHDPSLTAAPHRPQTSHAITTTPVPARARLTDGHRARRRAVARAHRAAARHQRRAAARHTKRARSRGKDAVDKPAPPPSGAEAPTAEPPAESAAPAQEAPTTGATPQASAGEPTTSASEESQTQKEFGFER